MEALNQSRQSVHSAQAPVYLSDSSEDDKGNKHDSIYHRADPHWYATCVFGFCCPLLFPCSFATVGQNTEVVTLHCGKYSNTYKDPGCFFINPVGLEKITISKAKLSIDLPNTKVIDFNGNPLIVSAVVVYQWVKIEKAALDMYDRENFVRNQASAVLRWIVSQYPYENLKEDTMDDHDNTGSSSSSEEAGKSRPCLVIDSEMICDHMVRALQSRINIAGGKVHSFRLNEMSYASEIAQGMLKKQQAAAIVQSRSTLVRGAVGIATTAMTKLSKRNIKMNHTEQTRLVSNLLTVVCADEKVHPMIQVG